MKKISPLRQPWVCSVSDLIFLAMAYEGRWSVLSLTVSSFHWQSAISALIIAELDMDVISWRGINLWYERMNKLFVGILETHRGITLVRLAQLLGEEDQLVAIFLQTLDIQLERLHRLVPAPNIDSNSNCARLFLVDACCLKTNTTETPLWLAYKEPPQTMRTQNKVGCILLTLLYIDTAACSTS